MSKRAEAIRTLRDMTDDELADHLRLQRRRLFELRFQQATGQVENHRQIRDTRREIARTMTVQIEVARGVVIPERVRPEPVAPAAPPRRRRQRSEQETPAVAESEEPALSDTEPSVEEVDPDE